MRCQSSRPYNFNMPRHGDKFNAKTKAEKDTNIGGLRGMPTNQAITYTWKWPWCPPQLSCWSLSLPARCPTGTACPQAGLRALRSAVCWGSAAVHQPQTDARHSSASAAAAFEFVPHGPAHSATFCTATVTLYGSKGPFVFIISTKHGLHSPVSAAAGFKSVPHSPAHCTIPCTAIARVKLKGAIFIMDCIHLHLQLLGSNPCLAVLPKVQ